jgi:hypothetical protein
MEIRAARTCFVVASFFLLFGGSQCGSSNSSSGPPTAPELGAKYTLSSTDLPGWQLDANDPPQVLEEGTAKDLYSLIDGGSETYTDAGCTVTVYEKLLGTSPHTAVIYAMYMGTDAKATAFFDDQKGRLVANDSVPGFGASVAGGYAGLASETVIAHFGTMFIRLTISGFGDNSTSALQAAAQFLTVLQSKTN